LQSSRRVWVNWARRWKNQIRFCWYCSAPLFEKNQNQSVSNRTLLENKVEKTGTYGGAELQEDFSILHTWLITAIGFEGRKDTETDTKAENVFEASAFKLGLCSAVKVKLQVAGTAAE
jgi:hypothetical protein